MVSRVGLETIAFAIPEKIHFESSRYAADDQYGFITLEIPS